MFYIYEYEMLAAEERECYRLDYADAWRSCSIDGELLGTFDTVQEADKFFTSYKFPQDAYITPTKRGLDSVTYFQIELSNDEEGDDQLIVIKDNLPDDVRDAMEKHEQSYHKYLDWHSGSYRPLSDFIND